MTQKKYDLFVVGAGSGGVRAARIAAQHGANVAIAESKDFGGTCVNVGCVPKKLMVYASEFSRHFDDAKNFGWTADKPSFDWQTLIANKDQEILRLNNIYKNNLANNNVDIFEGHAKFIDNETVEIDGQQIKADKFLIATGGTPAVPPIDGSEHLMISDDMFALPDLPNRIVIVGAGYIGVEFAGIFSGLGSEVTMIHRGDSLLGQGFDQDLRDSLGTEMQKHPNINIEFNSELNKVEKQGSEYIVHTKDGKTIPCDVILAATGRKANTADLGLENTNIQLLQGGRIHVNADGQTDEPHIYAVGDVCNNHNLTPVAIREGHIMADRVIGHILERDVDYDFIATAVFSQPPVGTVGMSEEEARNAGLDIDVYKSEFRPMRNTISGRDEKTLMKLIVDKNSDRVLGFHMIGDNAPEIIQLASTLLRKGVTKTELDETIGIHPTSAEEFVTMRTPEP